MLQLDKMLWRLQCRINRRLPGGPDVRRRVPARFIPRGKSCDIERDTLPSPELCIVITTHARVEPCRALLEQLHASLSEAALSRRAFVLVLEDPSEAHDYAPVLALLEQRFEGRFAYRTATRRLGKPGRCFGYQNAFDTVRALSPRFALFLEDDIVIAPTFIRDALARWSEIDDRKKTVLYLCRFADDEPHGRWVQFSRRALPSGRVQLTQWFDLHAFLVDRRFFEQLDYTLFRPLSSRWQDPARSSGVSEQFTLRLFRRGNIYQVCETLGLHGGVPSVLNAEARHVRPLNNHPRPEAPQAEDA